MEAMKKNDSDSCSKNSRRWKRMELSLLILYAMAFYSIIICRSLHLSRDLYSQLYGLRPGWLTIFTQRPNDISDAQWRNFRGNLPVLTVVFVIFTLVANKSRAYFGLRGRGMSIVWLCISLIYLSYLHGACILFILSIASFNYLLVKIFARKKYFLLVIWSFNIFFLLCNRVYGGYSFSMMGKQWAFLDNFRGTFRWHICFNFVVLRMISFGYDYHWADQNSHFDQKKHIQRCDICKSGKACCQTLQERCVQNGKYAYITYVCYLVYAPLYLAGPIINFNAFASQKLCEIVDRKGYCPAHGRSFIMPSQHFKHQIGNKTSLLPLLPFIKLDVPQNNYSARDKTSYALRWIFSLVLMELMAHLFHYNAFAISGLWKQLAPMDVFIIGYGVLNFMWLKFFLIWRYFRFWSLICGIEAPENMPRCINNCHSLESFWKNWHASYNKWLVRYMYIPLGGSQMKLLNVWVIFTFVAVWHDLEWKLLSWAWLTCLFFVPEMMLKSAATTFQADSAFGEFVFRELRAFAGAITITCLMVANLVGYVIGPSGMNWLVSQLLQEGLSVLGCMLLTFYVGTKLMFHIDDSKLRRH